MTSPKLTNAQVSWDVGFEHLAPAQTRLSKYAKSWDWARLLFFPRQLGVQAQVPKLERTKVKVHGLHKQKVLDPAWRTEAINQDTGGA